MLERLFYNNYSSELERNVIELNNFSELKKVFHWQLEPVLDISELSRFEYVEDVNERRIRDAEVLGTVMRNVNPNVALEIGTGTGASTVIMSMNSPETKIYTVNALPKEIESGKAGKFTTIGLSVDMIGAEYRRRGLTNITQIYANTKRWVPRMGNIGVAFIDGCHDSKFVYNDSRIALSRMSAGSFLLWHDFNPELAHKYEWIKSVCSGVGRLLLSHQVTGRIFHVRDSWVGVYQVSK